MEPEIDLIQINRSGKRQYVGLMILVISYSMQQCLVGPIQHAVLQCLLSTVPSQRAHSNSGIARGELRVLKQKHPGPLSAW